MGNAKYRGWKLVKRRNGEPSKTPTGRYTFTCWEGLWFHANKREVEVILEQIKEAEAIADQEMP